MAVNEPQEQAFCRRCYTHRDVGLEGDELICPIEGRPSHRRKDDPGWKDSPLAWTLFHVATNRLAATVIGESVRWEPWCAGPETKVETNPQGKNGKSMAWKDLFADPVRKRQRARRTKLRLKSGELSHAEWLRRLRGRLTEADRRS